MIIKTDRLVLRPLSTNDLYTTHKYSSDVENTRYMINLPNKNKASEKLMVKIGMKLESDQGKRQYSDDRGTSGEYKYSLEQKPSERTV